MSSNNSGMEIANKVEAARVLTEWDFSKPAKGGFYCKSLLRNCSNSDYGDLESLDNMMDIPGEVVALLIQQSDSYQTIDYGNGYKAICLDTPCHDGRVFIALQSREE